MPTKIEPGNYKEVDFSKCVVLQSNDQKPTEFVVEREAAKMSGLIKDMLEDQDEEDQQTIIPIPNVNGRTLEYVLEYCEHHWNNRPDPIDKPLRGRIDDVISPWDRKFIWTDLIKGGDEKQHELLIEVIMAANFLNIKDLLDLTCATVASLLKGKTTEQIRALFNIDNDFTPEEEEKIKEENRWCDEA
ncbi:SCF ubiquitin ligase complex protein SKP1a [Diplonema papillatum]|nr:SCF ubiquitin ligase complex protein SKP1a [Diplonema papillatum]